MKKLSVKTKVKLVGDTLKLISHHAHRTNFVVGAIGVIEGDSAAENNGYYVRIGGQLAHVCSFEVVEYRDPNYIPIGRLIQDLEQAYVAATRARKLAHQLVIKACKRKSPRPDKVAAARKQKSRSCSNWNRIRAELIRYKKMVADAFTVIAYDGCIVGKYKNAKTVTCFEMKNPPIQYSAN